MGQTEVMHFEIIQKDREHAYNVNLQDIRFIKILAKQDIETTHLFFQVIYKLWKAHLFFVIYIAPIIIFKPFVVHVIIARHTWNPDPKELTTNISNDFCCKRTCYRLQITPMNEMPIETIVQIPVTLTPFRPKE